MIAAHYPYYAPDYRVEIDGDELPAAVRNAVTSVRYEDGIGSLLVNPSDEEGTGAADRVEIELANPDLRWLQRHIRGLGFRPFPTNIKTQSIRAVDFDEGLFNIDNKLSLQMGYIGDQLGHMFDGEITGIEADFPNTGMPVLRIVAHDYLHRLAQGKYGRGFGPIPDFLIASLISAENLLLPAIDPVVSAASTATAALNFIFKGTGRKQAGQSNLQLLKEIADTYDAEFWVEGDVLYLSRVFGKEYTPRLSLTWGKSLMSFSPRVSTVGQVAGVAVKFLLPILPLEFTVTVVWDFDRESLEVKIIPCAGAIALKSLAGSVLTIIDRSLNDPADIANSALLITRMLRSKLNNRLTGSGTAIGDPRIRAGAIIELDGLGPNFSGNYRVTSASHVIDGSGYRTHFKVRKEIIP